jgi:hypothetical protein
MNITIRIRRDGAMTVETTETVGPACTQVTRILTEALGAKVHACELKPEHDQLDVQLNQTTHLHH